MASLHEATLLTQTSGIYIAGCEVTPFRVASGWTLPSLHAVTYDAWRRLLYVGGGDSSKKWLCGLILVEESDRADPSRLITHFLPA